MIPSLSEIKHGVVSRALAILPRAMGGASAVNGLTGIGAKESQWFRYSRQIGGPALGYWMVEPETHDDIWDHFLAYRYDIRFTIMNYLGSARPYAEMMVADPVYACMMARLVLWRHPDPLPGADDALGWAECWKRDYNTSAGAGDAIEALPYFEAAIAA